MISPSELSRVASTLGGVVILGCLRNSPAERAGIRYGDILLSVNGTPTATWSEFFQARRKCKGQMTVRIFREGREFDVTLDMPTTPLSPQAVLAELQIRDLLPTAAPAARDSRQD